MFLFVVARYADGNLQLFQYPVRPYDIRLCGCFREVSYFTKTEGASRRRFGTLGVRIVLAISSSKRERHGYSYGNVHKKRQAV